MHKLDAENFGKIREIGLTCNTARRSNTWESSPHVGLNILQTFQKETLKRFSLRMLER